jgi:hypothetical protein
MSARADLNRVTNQRGGPGAGLRLSTHALGNAEKTDVEDIVYVRPSGFEVEKTVQIAAEIGRINAHLVMRGASTCWWAQAAGATADRWLGIPVTWNDICGVAAIVETASAQLRVETVAGLAFLPQHHYAWHQLHHGLRQGGGAVRLGLAGGAGNFGHGRARRACPVAEAHAHQSRRPDFALCHHPG